MRVQSDVLLIAAGAGFSADSGLPVYKDIANVDAYERLGIDYQDLCDPGWLRDDPEMGLGFWGECFNLYRNTLPHHGYAILNSWREACSLPLNLMETTYAQLVNTGVLASSDVISVSRHPFYIYTSNVDGHFLKHGFNANELYEIHGNLDQWQCAGKNGGPPCQEKIWRAEPAPFNFRIDPISRQTQISPPQARFLTCDRCHKLSRPNVLMFRDKKWIPNKHLERAYVAWEAAIETILKSDPSKRLVVLEIGCGLQVPSVRLETEMVVKDVLQKCGTSSIHQACLIRINPETDESLPLLPSESFIQIKDTALNALRQINNLRKNV